MNLQRLLIPLDGSRVAEAALPYARGLARPAGSTLHLLTVLDAAPGGLTGLRPSLAATLASERRERAHAYLTTVAGRERQLGFTVEIGLCEGDVANGILDAARRTAAGLICMATHGRGGLQRLTLGSIADAVLRGADRPVMLVPAPDEGSPSPAEISVRRILVPLDGSLLAEAALGPAVQLATLVGASLTLVQVAPYDLLAHGGNEFVPDVTLEPAPAVHAAQDYLRGVRERLPVDVEVRAGVANGAVAPALADFARTNRVDLTVMTTHGRGGFRRFVVGSVADGLVRSRIATLLLPAGAVEGTPERAGAAVPLGLD